LNGLDASGTQPLGVEIAGREPVEFREMNAGLPMLQALALRVEVANVMKTPGTLVEACQTRPHRLSFASKGLDFQPDALSCRSVLEDKHGNLASFHKQSFSAHIGKN
jgi:hypothetical protein